MGLRRPFPRTRVWSILMADNTGPAEAPAISAAQVRQFLRENPRFLMQENDLLEQLNVPHATFGAASLIERQVTLLRERNHSLTRKLNTLIVNARDNDRLFERTKRLTLNLLDCSDAGDLVESVFVNLQKEFAIPYVQILLVDRAAGGARRVQAAELNEALGDYWSARSVASGRLPRPVIDYVFERDAGQVQSAALAVLGISEPLGVLAVGSRDPEHYQSGMGTLFLGHITELLGRLLPRQADGRS